MYPRNGQFLFQLSVCVSPFSCSYVKYFRGLNIFNMFFFLATALSSGDLQNVSPTPRPPPPSGVAPIVTALKRPWVHTVENSSDSAREKISLSQVALDTVTSPEHSALKTLA